MIEVMNRKVEAWRTERLLLDDNDFAFVFSSADQAYTKAGRAVAEAWLRVRRQQSLHLATDAARVLSLPANVIKKVDSARAELGQVRKGQPKSAKAERRASSLRNPGKAATEAVSYTHLTLPTILRV